MNDDHLASPGEVTRLLHALGAGEATAYDQLLPMLQAELHRAAERLLRRERPGHTLQPTELVHEAWLRIADGKTPDFASRQHFLAVAARAMRHVLVDHARRRLAGKRGGGALAVSLPGELASPAPPEEILALDEALERLAVHSPRLKQVVEYRFFGGLEEAEIASLMGVTTRTVQRDWAKARAWLHQELAQGPR